MDGLSEALGRFNKAAGEPKEEEREEEAGPRAETSEHGGKGHAFHVHKHEDGKHHLMVHGEHGKLMHHSEHASLEEAADEMKNHGE